MRRFVLVLAVVALVAVACRADEPIETVEIPAVDTGTRITDERSPAVGVEAVGCGLVPSIGSGFGLADDGLVVTTAHTVAGATDITVFDTAGRSLPATVRSFDPTKDIAVLAVDGLAARQPAIVKAKIDEAASIAAWRRPAPVGDRAFVELSAVVTRRLIVTIEDIYVQGSYERTAIEVSTGVVSGDSGAPVLNETGDVIGMVYATSRERSVAFALDHVEINAALDAAAASTSAVSNGRCA